jgi:hypothetical protein
VQADVHLPGQVSGQHLSSQRQVVPLAMRGTALPKNVTFSSGSDPPCTGPGGASKNPACAGRGRPACSEASSNRRYSPWDSAAEALNRLAVDGHRPIHSNSTCVSSLGILLIHNGIRTSIASMTDVAGQADGLLAEALRQAQPHELMGRSSTAVGKCGTPAPAPAQSASSAGVLATTISCGLIRITQHHPRWAG